MHADRYLQLRYLNLSHNSIAGPIPKAIGRLTGLGYVSRRRSRAELGQRLMGLCAFNSLQGVDTGLQPHHLLPHECSEDDVTARPLPRCAFTHPYVLFPFRMLTSETVPTTEANPTLLYMPAEVMLRARADPGFLLKWNSTKVRGVNDGLVAYPLSP